MRKSLMIVTGIYCLTSLASLMLMSGCANSTNDTTGSSSVSVSEATR